MHRTGTERKTEPKRQSEQDRQQKQKPFGSEAASNWAQTLSALLAGGSRDQLPQEGILGLSGVMGNSALAELLTMRSVGPNFSEAALPGGTCETAPMEIPVSGAPPFLEGSPTAPIGNVQPMTTA